MNQAQIIITTPCKHVLTHTWSTHAHMAATAVWCLLKGTAMLSGTRTLCKGDRIGSGPGQTKTSYADWCYWISHYWPVSPVHSSGSPGFHFKCPLSGTDHHIRFFKIKNYLFFFPLLHLPWSWLLYSQTLDSCGQAPAWQLQQAAVFSVRPLQSVFTLVTVPLWLNTNVPSIFLMFFRSIKYVISALQIIIIVQI